MSYRSTGRLTLSRIAVLMGWSVAVMLVTGMALFLFTFGDCLNVAACKAASNRNFLIIAGSGFVVYWAVFLTLVRHWSSK